MTPLYDFHCEDCGYNFEALVAVRETVACEDCGSKHVMRRISFPAGYSIKGNNSASTSPKRCASAEIDRKEAKKERVDKIVKRQLEVG